MLVYFDFSSFHSMYWREEWLTQGPDLRNKGLQIYRHCKRLHAVVQVQHVVLIVPLLSRSRDSFSVHFTLGYIRSSVYEYCTPLIVLQLFSLIKYLKMLSFFYYLISNMNYAYLKGQRHKI